MPKDTKTLGNSKARACESLGFVHKKGCARVLTHLQSVTLYSLNSNAYYSIISRLQDLYTQYIGYIDGTRWIYRWDTLDI